MTRKRCSFILTFGLGAAVLMLGFGLPAVAQVECDPDPSPYVFILFDTSTSMNLAPPCASWEYNMGECSLLCSGPECSTPLQADSPDSKFFQVKSGLYEALSSTSAENVSFGFATFNQDALNAGMKHWLYVATGYGVSVPGWGAFPSPGTLEVVGATVSCGSGSGDGGVGCSSTNPADLSDPWELSRVRGFPKGGMLFSQIATFFIRHGGFTYRMQYLPFGAGTIGGPLTFNVRSERCLNSSCSSRAAVVMSNVPYQPIAEYLAWDNGASRAEPVGYFPFGDAQASNSCVGWDPNTDSVADAFNGYSLRWPTTPDLRGSLLDSGDVIPLDWLNDHRQEIRERLAPNVALNPLATPDFRSAPYLEDARLSGESFLRLKNEAARPLLAAGATPHGATLQAFRTWYTGWADLAAEEDPQFACRPRNVLLITDGEETCEEDPCAVAADLYTRFGVRTWVVAYGVSTFSPLIECMAADGGTYGAISPRNPYQLRAALEQIFEAAGEP